MFIDGVSIWLECAGGSSMNISIFPALDYNNANFGSFLYNMNIIIHVLKTSVSVIIWSQNDLELDNIYFKNQYNNPL